MSSWPPFVPGHEQSTVHGARSPRRLEPLAAEIAAALLEAESTPEHLRRPEFAAAVAAWSRSEAVVALLWQWLDAQDIDAALTDVTRATETEEHTKARSTRRSVTKRVGSVLDQLHRAESRANSLRRELGLTPAAAGKLARDLSQSRWYQGASPLDAALDRIERERRAAIEAGGDGGG